MNHLEYNNKYSKNEMVNILQRQAGVDPIHAPLSQ